MALAPLPSTGCADALPLTRLACDCAALFRDRLSPAPLVLCSQKRVGHRPATNRLADIGVLSGGAAQRYRGATFGAQNSDKLHNIGRGPTGAVTTRRKTAVSPTSTFLLCTPYVSCTCEPHHLMNKTNVVGFRHDRQTDEDVSSTGDECTCICCFVSESDLD